MKPLTFLAVALSLLFAASSFAVPVTVVESGSAFIRPEDAGTPPWYSSNLNASVAAVNRFPGGNPSSGDPLWAMILWYFNLTPYTNLTFNGNVTVSCGMNWGENGPLPWRLYTVVSDWNEATVTWENFLGPDTTNNNPPYSSYPNNNQAFTNVLGVELALQQCYGTAVYADGTNTWTFPGSLIQSWLNNPANNKGIALVPQWYANQEWCTRNRNWQMVKVPTLKADIVPEPAIFALGLLALGLCLRRR